MGYEEARERAIAAAALNESPAYIAAWKGGYMVLSVPWTQTLAEARAGIVAVALPTGKVLAGRGTGG